MHNNTHHRAVASRRGGSVGSGGERRMGALELVALAIVFIVGVSFGMYMEGRQHHDELQSYASPKSMALLSRQQQQQQQEQQQQMEGGRGCEAVVKQAVSEQEETWRALVGQLQAENEGCTARAAGMLLPEQVPADCRARLKPPLHKKLFAPSQKQQQQQPGQQKEQEEEEEEAGDEALRAAVECGSAEDAAAGKRLKALQAETGYHVLASMEIDPVLDAFLSHMVPYEREEMKKKALLVGNKVGHKRDTSLVAEPIPFQDSTKCHSLGLVMTPSDGGACTLLVPMDRSTTSRTIYMHERFEDAEAGKREERIKWRPVGKSSKEAELGVQAYHRRPAEEALFKLFQHLPEIESEVKALLEEMVGPADSGGGDKKNKKGEKQQEQGNNQKRPHVKVMILNSGNMPMFLNMMCSARRGGVNFQKDLLVFAADAGVEATLQRLGYRTYRHAAFGDFSPAEHMAYGDQHFLHMMWLKTVSGWLVNRLDYDLLYLDSDLIYRKNTDALFEDAAVDIFMQDDGARSERFGPYFGNTGFFFVRANAKTKHLMQMMLYAYELVLAWRSHQAVFTYLMEDIYVRNLLTVKIIPLDLLPSGKIYHHRKQIMKELVDGKRDYYVFHMNWALHNQDKIKYYKELGWWYIDDACNLGADPLPEQYGSVEDCCVEPGPMEWPPKEEKKKS